MNQERLSNNTAILSTENKLTQKTDFDVMIEEWASIKGRKLQLLVIINNIYIYIFLKCNKIHIKFRVLIL